MASKPADATLLDVLIDGFEKNEMLFGFHRRMLPLSSEKAAARRCAAWKDLEIRQEGRGVMLLVKAPRFAWWQESRTWSGDPMGALHDWVAADQPRALRKSSKHKRR